jgi:F0F1-type ATP synthase assembly protein I
MTLPTEDSGQPTPTPSVKPLPSMTAFVGMGTSVAGSVGVGVWLGIVADDHFRTAPTFLIVGVLLGITAAVTSVVAQIRRYL